jgi:hypothetical protein
LDHAEAARQCIDAGMRGLVLKDQHSLTCNQVYFLRNYIFKDAPLHIFGGLVLNNATGGINPYTVDAAIKYGAKIIWMPTASAKNHIESHSIYFPHTKEKPPEEPPLVIQDAEGKLCPEVVAIVKNIAKADIILGTGHLYLKEIKLLVDEAIQQGVKKILMNHPEFMINASIDDMIDLANKGVFIEHSYVVAAKGIITKEYLVEMIRKVCAERTIIGSDLGQANNPYPVEGFRSFIQDMLERGVKDEEIDLMIRRNPARLLGLES